MIVNDEESKRLETTLDCSKSENITVDGFDDISNVHFVVEPGAKKLIWFRSDKSSGKKPKVVHDWKNENIIDV